MASRASRWPTWRPALLFAAKRLDPATAGPIHTPCFVGLNQQVENLLRCQAFMPIDVNRRVADAECFADVGFFFSGARGQLYDVLFARQGDAEAVFAAADE